MALEALTLCFLAATWVRQNGHQSVSEVVHNAVVAQLSSPPAISALQGEGEAFGHSNHCCRYSLCFHCNCHFGPMNHCAKSSRENPHLRLAGEERLSFFLPLSNVLLRSGSIESVVVLWLNENLEKFQQTFQNQGPIQFKNARRTQCAGHPRNPYEA